MLNIVIDKHIPFIQGVLEPFANVTYAEGALIDKKMVAQADAIIIRTRTKCNRDLLEGSKVRFIATATIGYDHIDTFFCEKEGIEWTNAPGCNSGSVMQYIASVLSVLKLRKGIDVNRKTIGVVGVGNVGSKVSKLCKALGMRVLLCDPPRYEAEGGDFVSYERVLAESDIITYHVPLIRDGRLKTFHMLNMNTIDQLKNGIVLINSSRGSVVDGDALLKGLKKGKIAEAILDVWEHEPQINKELLELVMLGTPHIAGYSADGKANGTAMSIAAVSKFFNLPISHWYPSEVPSVNKPVFDNNVFNTIIQTYDVQKDSEKLKNDPEHFELFRSSYPVRREFHTFHLNTNELTQDQLQQLESLGFSLTE